jgi:hypothetical protein
MVVRSLSKSMAGFFVRHRRVESVVGMRKTTRENLTLRGWDLPLPPPLLQTGELDRVG